MLHPTTIDEINFWDLAMFSQGNPHAAWKILREQAPVYYHDKPGGESFWCVTRYDDVRAVHSDAVLYSSERNGIMLRNDEQLAAPSMDDVMPMPPMIHTDPPRHQPLRKLVSHNFTPKSVSELEAELRGYATECFDDAADKGEVDFVTDIAHRIPAAIAFSLMDVPRADWDRLSDLEHQTVTRSDPEFQSDGETDPTLELAMYFYELITERQQNLGDDLLSQYLLSELDGEPLPITQIVAEAILFLAGGLDTTRAAASAGAMLPLLDHPDQLAALADDRSLIPAAVEEMVRWASPITSETRTVIRDTDFEASDGQTYRFAEGDRVTMWSPSANRDARQFDAPDTYDIRRSPNRHIGFAYGEHFCLGAHLARLTLRVEFEELFARFSGFELVGEPSRVHSNFVGGLKHLPVRLTPR
ncbi:MAG: cytochrome P450 [Acidimicrobiales bacterium]|nr:cytochrome P450 [Acidimicrobiales bacterium]